MRKLQLRTREDASITPSLRVSILLGVQYSVLLVIFLLLSFKSSAQCHTCIAWVNFSIGSDCIDTVQIQDLVSNSSSCTGDVAVRLIGNDVIQDSILDFSAVGQTYIYEIYNTISGQVECHGELLAKDGGAPGIIICPRDTVLACFEQPGELGIPEATDCDSNLDFSFVDMWVDRSCEDTSMILLRRHEVADQDNNIDTCTQRIFFLRPSIDSIRFPSSLVGDSALSCTSNTSVDPGITGFPSYQGIEITEALCDYDIDFGDVMDESCGNSFVVKRTWYITDVCADSQRIGVQIIEVRDTSGPDIVLLDTLRMGLETAECLTAVNLPSAVVSDDCGDEFEFLVSGPFLSFQANGGVVEDIPAGIHEVVYTVTDPCLNRSRDTLILVIEDLSPPNAICKAGLVLPLNSQGSAWLPASALNQASFDNCENVYFKVRRMDPNPDCQVDNPQNLFGDGVRVCCEDAELGSVMVILRVYDRNPGPGLVSLDTLDGRYSDCMVEVEVQDKVAPTLQCPTDITVSCELVFDFQDPTIFGEIRSSSLDREQICIDDPGQGGIICQGLDGYVEDVCGFQVFDSLVDLGSTCGAGVLRREITVEDQGGNQNSCHQTIVVESFDPFFINSSDPLDPTDDVVWPLDYEVSDICDLDELQPQNLPVPSAMPILTEGICDQAVANFEDEVFDFSLGGDACIKILREWKVVDWCQSTSDSLAEWRYQQTIIVYNTISPVISGETSALEVCAEDDCGSAFVSVSIEASDDCTPTDNLQVSFALDLNSDNSVDLNGNDLQFQGNLPLGDHRITWQVEDLCGNSASRTRVIRVISCKKPTPVCHDNIVMVLMPLDSDNDGEFDAGMLEVNASHFDKGSFHVCGYDVQASYSSSILDVTRTFDCSDLGDNPLEIWITDEKGNQEFCEVTLEIQDQNEIPGCDNLQSSQSTIAGAIVSTEESGMPDVMLSILNSDMETFSDEYGLFAFQPMPSGGEYSILPSYESPVEEGLSTLDMLLIQQHLLGIQYFTVPEQYIAADVNRSGSVTALDIIDIRKVLLGQELEFPNNESWCFVNQDFVFSSPESALEYEFPELYEIEDFDGDMLEVDFTAIKIGDINQSYIESNFQEMENRTTPVRLELTDVYLPEGLEYSIPLYLEWQDQPIGVQFTLQVDPAKFEISGWQLGQLDESQIYSNVDTERGLIHVSWIAGIGESQISAALGSLQVKVKESGSISDGIGFAAKGLSPEVYFGLQDIRPLEMDFLRTADKVLSEPRFVPNPFTDYTNLEVELSRDGLLEVEIYNATGQLIFTVSRYLSAGKQQIRISNENFELDGVYYCKLKAFESVQTTKLFYISN